MRLDCFLVEKHWVASRQKAQELIAKGVVLVDKKPIFKNSYEILSQNVEILPSAPQWVARSGEKLDLFLQECLVGIEGREVLDIGSSTGGFSEVLLKRGARRVVCVDVGSNQLHPTLRENPKITFFENQDIREFCHPPFELVVCDVSFISLRLLVGKIIELMQKECVLLFKPQFEVGKNAKRNKRGVLMDREEIERALFLFLSFVQEFGLKIQACQKSQIKGKCGNEEYFIYLCK